MIRGIKYVALLPPGGYAEAAKRAILGLLRAGVAVTYTPLVRGSALGLNLEPYGGRSLDDPGLAPLCNRPIAYDTVILHAPPELFPPLAAREPGKHVIGQTVWETDRLPPRWLPWLDAVDRVIVPCRWNRDVFLASGVRRPVDVVPAICDHGADAAPPLLGPGADGRFVFYSIGLWSSRKGLDHLVRAYLSAFRAGEPVLLVVKTSQRDLKGLTPWGGPRPTWLSLARLRWKSRSRAPIQLVTSELSEAQMRGLHARGSCYVSLAHGEGWGFGAFDAAAAGNPAVVTGFGGPLEYLGADYPYLIRHLPGPAVAEGEESGIFSPDQNWAIPDEADAAEKMRRVFARPEAAREAVRAVGTRLRSEYAADRVTAELLRVIDGRAGAGGTPVKAILGCWRLLSPALRRRWLWLVPIGALAALLDVATGAALLKTATSLTRGGSGLFGAGPARSLALLGVLIAAKTALRFFETDRREACAEQSAGEFSRRVLGFWLEAPMRRQLATPEARRIDDVQYLAHEVGREGIHSLILFWSEGLVVVGLLGLLFFAAPWPALLILVLCGSGAILTLRLAHVRHARGVAALAPARVRTQAFVQDCVAGSREIRLHGEAGVFTRRYAERRAALGDIVVGLERWKSVPLLANEALFLFGAIGLLAFSASRGAATEAASGPLLLLFLYAGLRMLPAMNRLIYRGLALRAARPAAERVEALLPERPPSRPAARALPEFHSGIAVISAAVNYPDRTVPALDGASLEVRRGEKLAVVGPSGSGKSTLLLLLAALLDPDRGRVEVDGRPLALDDPSWQRRLGFVAQDAPLIEDTVRANIALGREAHEIDADALASAAAIAQLDSVLAALPQGLDTRLDNSGRELSGGQRQRIALARELYRRPALLLLDEATAFVDRPVEEKIFAALARERPELTVVFVTHRLHSIGAAGRVAFLRAGKVEACGTLAELSGNAEFQAFLKVAEKT